MKIRLLSGTQNMAFWEKTDQYLLLVEPQMISPTLAETVFDGAKRQFVRGMVEVFKIGETPPDRPRAQSPFVLSEQFYDEQRYTAALRDGFKVSLGAEHIARLLVTHQLAQKV